MQDSRTYALIGAAGYVAPRHMAAIKQTGGTLAAAYDPADSVGFIDRHFPDAEFFTEFERFAEYVGRANANGRRIDRIAICSPNDLHKPHADFALRAGADVVCEKPLTLEPGEIDDLAARERQSGRRINAILQLRLHPAIIALRDKVCRSNFVHDVDLTYVTARGRWYHASWKGDERRSGGIATNIGVHFYDVLTFIFGAPLANIVHHRASDRAAGYLEFERARVRWLLSINRHDLNGADGFALRAMTVEGLGHFDFSKGFEDLHTASYQEIEAGRGFSLQDARPAIEIVSAIRKAPLSPCDGHRHPHLARVLAATERHDSAGQS